MLHTDLKYNTSTDYDELYKLLKEGNRIIGFIAVEINGSIRKKYSKLVEMSYDESSKSFNLGFIIFESDFDKIGFKEICSNRKVKFIPIS
jgi:hypothetical protein